ncbi:UNVERIFIED_CONTAM: hypothetical protein HDU68_012168 [Siphonaria sp. JEL0065]|nr:hypothetical protein HDU68_012168 [Siphonaria sp. JEL0065]
MDGAGGMTVLDAAWVLNITETLVERVVGSKSNKGNSVRAVDAVEATKLIGRGHGESHEVAPQANEPDAVLLFRGMDLKSLSNRVSMLLFTKCPDLHFTLLCNLHCFVSSLLHALNPLSANTEASAMDPTQAPPSSDGYNQPFITQHQQPQVGDTNGAARSNTSFSTGEAVYSNAASLHLDYNAYPSSSSGILPPPPAFASVQSEPVQQQQYQNNHLDALQLLSDSAAQSSAPLQYEPTVTANNGSSFLNSLDLPAPQKQHQQHQHQQLPQPSAITFDEPVHQDFSNTPPTNTGNNTPPNSNNQLNNSTEFGSIDGSNGDGLGDFFGDDYSSGGQSIPFLPSVQKCHLWNADKSKLFSVDLKPKIDRGFFVAEGNWTCYRRNYFQLSSTFTITENTNGSTAETGGVSNGAEGGSSGVNGNVTTDVNSGGTTVDPSNPITIIANTNQNPPAKETYHLELNGSLVPITTFLTHISAHTNGSPKTAPVELVQHTSKRDKGPLTQPVPRVSEPGPSKTVFERIQFRTATSNNGRKKTTGTSGGTSPTSGSAVPTAAALAQQYFVVTVEVLCKVTSGEFYRVSESEMERGVVVRGRAPGHYMSRDGVVGSRDAAELERKKKEAEEPVIVNPVTGRAVRKAAMKPAIVERDVSPLPEKEGAEDRFVKVRPHQPHLQQQQQPHLQQQQQPHLQQQQQPQQQQQQQPYFQQGGQYQNPYQQQQQQQQGYGQRMGYPAQAGAIPGGYGQPAYGQYQSSQVQHRPPAGGIYGGFSSPLGLPQGLPQPGGGLSQGLGGYPSNNFGVPQGQQQQQQHNMYSNMMGSSGLGASNFGSYPQSLGAGASQNFGSSQSSLNSQSLLQPIPSPHLQQQQPYSRASALPPPPSGAQQQQQYSGYPPVSSSYLSAQGTQPLPPPSQTAQSGYLATGASAYPPQPQGQQSQQQRDSPFNPYRQLPPQQQQQQQQPQQNQSYPSYQQSQFPQQQSTSANLGSLSGFPQSQSSLAPQQAGYGSSIGTSAYGGNTGSNASYPSSSMYPQQPSQQSYPPQPAAASQQRTTPYGSYPPVSQQQSGYQPSALSQPPSAPSAAPQQKRPLRGDSVDSEESEYVDDGGSDDDYGGRKKRRN